MLNHFQVVEFVSKNCDVLFKYDDCAAVIGLSKANRRIIVAFRGSVSGLQVIEQGAQTATGMRDFPTGGKVNLFNCKTTTTFKLFMRHVTNLQHDIPARDPEIPFDIFSTTYSQKHSRFSRHHKGA